MWWFFCAPVAADVHQRYLKHVLGTTLFADPGTMSTLSGAVIGLGSFTKFKRPIFRPEVGSTV
jgi:hypothetical protein